jgi:4'-phosphopantetheinyl transferase EntD
VSTFYSPFPSTISFAYAHKDDVSDTALLPEESAPLAHISSPKRKLEYTLGRITARKALEKHGVISATPLLRGSDGEIIWPPDITGSISHSSEYALAAVTDKQRHPGIGIDIERVKHRPLATFNRILHKLEYPWVHEINISEPEKSIRALQIFSLKEATYKAFFSAYRTKLTFKDVSFSLLDEGTFEGTLHKNLSDHPSSFKSISYTRDRYVVSGVWL